MPNRIMRAALLSASFSLFLVVPLSAQDKATPKVLTQTTSSDAAKTALAAALTEITNFGGAARADAKLKAIVDADPDFALGRAVYGAYTTTMTPPDRNRELEAALKLAGNASAAEVLVITALREWRAGRNPVARDLMDAALKQAPDDPFLFWFRLNIPANAAEGLRLGEEGLKRFPDYAPIHNTVAYRLNTAGRKDEAFQVVQKYATLAPNHPNPHDSHAEILQLNGRFDEAIQHYQAALGIDPNFEAAHEGMAEVEVLRGNYPAARAHLQQAIALAAAPARRLTLQREVAATHLYEGKVKEAKAVITAVVADAEANAINALPDKRMVALLTALEGKGTEAATLYSAALPPNPAPAFPVSDAVFHAVLKHPAEVGKALATIEANAARTPDVMDTQEAMRATRVINAVANNDLNTARTTLQQITTPVYKAIAAAFLVQGARKAGDKATAQAAMADVEAYKAVNLNAGLARVIAARK
jgi:tetratricopeptide (TPR) repeat protein